MEPDRKKFNEDNQEWFKQTYDWFESWNWDYKIDISHEVEYPAREMDGVVAKVKQIIE